MTDRHVVIGQADTGNQASMLMRREHDKNAWQHQACNDRAAGPPEPTSQRR
jgi:hypothetical protein